MNRQDILQGFRESIQVKPFSPEWKIIYGDKTPDEVKSSYIKSASTKESDGDVPSRPKLMKWIRQWIKEYGHESNPHGRYFGVDVSQLRSKLQKDTSHLMGNTVMIVKMCLRDIPYAHQPGVKFEDTPDFELLFNKHYYAVVNFWKIVNKAYPEKAQV